MPAKSSTPSRRQTKFEADYRRYDTIGQEQISSISQLTSQEREDETRHEVTRKFVRFYFGILVLIIVGVPIYNLGIATWTDKSDLIIPFKDAILTYSAVVGPTFGLVVAYYFKTSRD